MAGRPKLTDQTKQGRANWKTLFNRVLYEHTARSVDLGELAFKATVYLKCLGCHRVINNNDLAHWANMQDLSRVPIMEEQTNALVYAMSDLGLWRDHPGNQLVEMRQLVEILGFNFYNLPTGVNSIFFSELFDRNIVWIFEVSDRIDCKSHRLAGNKATQDQFLSYLLDGKKVLVISITDDYQSWDSLKRNDFDTIYELNMPGSFYWTLCAIQQALERREDKGDGGPLDLVKNNLRFGLLPFNGLLYYGFCRPGSTIMMGFNDTFKITEEWQNGLLSDRQDLIIIEDRTGGVTSLSDEGENFSVKYINPRQIEGYLLGLSRAAIGYYQLDPEIISQKDIYMRSFAYSKKPLLVRINR